MPIGAPLHKVKEPLTCLWYGQEGSSKTTSALQLANRGRIVLIDVEGGAKPTALKKQGVKIENVEIWPNPETQGPGHINFDTIQEEVYIPMRAALEDDPNAYIGVVIDSFTELARRFIDNITEAGREKAQRTGKQRDRFQVDLADHGTNSQMVRTLLRQFRDLGIHMGATALERRDVDQDAGTVAYGPAMGPAVANDLLGLMDVVIYTRIEPIGPESEMFRLGYTIPFERRRAKDRFGVLPTKMVNPTADRILGYLEGSLEKSTDPEQARARAAATAGQEPAAEAAGASEVVAEGPPWKEDALTTAAPEELVPEDAATEE